MPSCVDSDCGASTWRQHKLSSSQLTGRLMIQLLCMCVYVYVWGREWVCVCALTWTQLALTAETGLVAVSRWQRGDFSRATKLLPRPPSCDISPPRPSTTITSHVQEPEEEEAPLDQQSPWERPLQEWGGGAGAGAEGRRGEWTVPGRRGASPGRSAEQQRPTLPGWTPAGSQRHPGGRTHHQGRPRCGQTQQRPGPTQVCQTR